jgi:hypothetical protein
VFVSDDNGRTFTAFHPTFSDCYEAHVIELASGKLLGAFRHQRRRLLSETDEQIKSLGGAPERSAIRVGAGNASVFRHVFLADSDDGGQTWHEFRPLRTKEGQPLLVFGECHGDLVQMSDGKVVLVHDRRPPQNKFAVVARVSRDEGKTWSPHVYHLSRGQAYPASVALEDGTIVTLSGDVGHAQVIRWRLSEP